MQPESSSSLPEGMEQTPSPAPTPQYTPPPAQPAPQYAPPPSKPAKKINFVAIFGGIFLCILLVAVAGLGYWAYQLNTNLTTTQQELAKTKDELAKQITNNTLLTGEKEKLTADLTQANADLEKTKTDLATAQADLEKANKEIDSLKAKIAIAKKYADVAVAFYVNNSSNSVMRAKIKLTEDSTLLDLFDTLDKNRDEASYWDFVEYMIDAIASKLE